MLAGLGVEIPLTVTLEQPTYFAPAGPRRRTADMPLWIWMDEPSYYGFPCYGEPTVKAAQDCGGPTVDPDHRTSEPDPEMRDRLAAFMGSLLPGTGPAGAVAALPVHADPRPRLRARARARPSVASSSGSGSAHGFKFAPTFGRILADLVDDGGDHLRRLGVRLRPARPHRPGVPGELDGLTRGRRLTTV